MSFLPYIGWFVFGAVAWEVAGSFVRGWRRCNPVSPELDQLVHHYAPELIQVPNIALVGYQEISDEDTPDMGGIRSEAMPNLARRALIEQLRIDGHVADKTVSCRVCRALAFLVEVDG